MTILLYQWQYNDFNGGNKKGLFCRFVINVLQIGDAAEIEAENCMPALNLI